MMKKTNKAVTLVEVLVGLLLTTILGLGVYSFMSGARTITSLTAAKASLNLEAELILRQFERDVASSRNEMVEENGSRIFRKKVVPGNGKIVLEVPAKELPEDATMFDQSMEAENQTYVSVTYALQGNELLRIFDGKSRRLSANVKSFVFDTTDSGNLNETYDGKVQVILTLSMRPDGNRDPIEIEHRLTVSVRQALDKNGTKNWKQRIDATDPNSF